MGEHDERPRRELTPVVRILRPTTRAPPAPKTDSSRLRRPTHHLERTARPSTRPATTAPGHPAGGLVPPGGERHAQLQGPAPLHHRPQPVLGMPRYPGPRPRRPARGTERRETAPRPGAGSRPAPPAPPGSASRARRARASATATATGTRAPPAAENPASATARTSTASRASSTAPGVQPDTATTSARSHALTTTASAHPSTPTTRPGTSMPPIQRQSRPRRRPDPRDRKQGADRSAIRGRLLSRPAPAQARSRARIPGCSRRRVRSRWTCSHRAPRRRAVGRGPVAERAFHQGRNARRADTGMGGQLVQRTGLSLYASPSSNEATAMGSVFVALSEQVS
jgi:hypothetical protein